jgi:hypothetical protein
VFSTEQKYGTSRQIQVADHFFWDMKWSLLYTKLHWNIKFAFQTNFDHPTYFILNLSFINIFRKVFMSSNYIIIIEIDYNKFISKSFILKIDKCCHSHVSHLRIPTKILYDIWVHKETYSFLQVTSSIVLLICLTKTKSFGDSHITIIIKWVIQVR